MGQPIPRVALVATLTGYLAPVTIAPIYFLKDKAISCAYVALLMSTWMLLDTVPVPVVSLTLPFLLFPILDVWDVAEIAHHFVTDNIMLLMLGLSILVLATEDTNLCARAALYILAIFGSRMRAVLTGVTVAAFVVTQVLMTGVTTLLMCAIVEATMFELQHDIISSSYAKAAQQQRRVKTAVDEDDLHMTAISVIIISPHTTPGSTTEEVPSYGAEPRTHEVTGAEPCVQFSTTLYSLAQDAPNDLESKNQLITESSSPTTDHHGQEHSDNEIAGPKNGTSIAAGKRRASILKCPHTTKLLVLEANRLNEIRKALMMSVTLGASVGSVSNALGNPPIIFLRDYFKEHFGWGGISSLSWLVVSLPASVVSTCVCFLIQYYGYLRKYDIQESKEVEETIQTVIRRKLHCIGGPTIKELFLLASFVSVFTMWYVGHSRGTHVGFEELRTTGTDEVTTLYIVIVVLTIVPERLTSVPIISWRDVSKRIPWTMLVTVGGGVVMTAAMRNSGFCTKMMLHLSRLAFLTPLQTQIILSLLSAILTEFHTDTVISRVLIPAVSDLAVETSVHPLYYALPVAMASTTSIILPTGATSIAIVHAITGVNTAELVSPGLIVKAAALVAITAFVNSIGDDVFHWKEIPAWVYNVTIRNGSSLQLQPPAMKNSPAQ